MLITPPVILDVNVQVAEVRGEVFCELVDDALLGNVERQKNRILFE